MSTAETRHFHSSKLLEQVNECYGDVTTVAANPPLVMGPLLDVVDLVA